PGFLVEGHRVDIRQNDQTWQLTPVDGGQSNQIPPQLEAKCRIISHVYRHHHYLLGAVEV
ncbi:FAD-dependent oxidoreductase, partial [Raoultella ornithinolytica]